MKIIIRGEPKEIAALVIAVQERQLSEIKEGVCLFDIQTEKDVTCTE